MGFYVRSAHIKHEEVNDFIENFTLCELFEGLSAFWTHKLSVDNVSLPYFDSYQ